MAAPRRRSRALPLIAAGLGLAAVVICGGNAIAQQFGGGAGTNGGSSAPTTPVRRTADRSTTANAKDQAVALRNLLSSSGAARKSIQSAIADVSSCGDLSADAAVFEAAATNRSRHREQADALDYSALPNGGQLHQILADALAASYQADGAYRDWAASLDGNCTRSAARSSSLLTDATNFSKTANGFKKKFVALWNPVCRSYGWAAWKDTDV